VAAIALGILVNRFVPVPQAQILLAIGAFLVLGALSFYRGARLLAVTCCLLGLFFTGQLLALMHAPAPPPGLDVEGREIVILGGCVVEPPAISGERERFLLELAPRARAQVTLYTKDGEELPPLRYGQNIELDARVRKPRNYGNPGDFDYRHFLARQNIYWTASGAAASVRVLPGHCGSPLVKAAMDMRQAVLRRSAELYRGDDYLSGMMQAMLMGQNFQLQKVWTEAYRNTGTFHVIVISGTHLAILAAFLLFLLRLCFVPENLATLLTSLAAWLYAMTSGWGAPCVRCAAGLTLYMVGRYFYRERRALNLLAAIALFFLIADPEQLFESSFQLSFLAVAFLGAFASPLVEATSGPLSRGLSGLRDTGRDLHVAPRVAQFRIEMRLLIETLQVPPAMVTVPVRVLLFFYEVAVVSAVIQLGLALPMVVYFHRLGLSGLSANAFAIPLMGLAVPAGFLAVFTGWHWMAAVAGWLMQISQVIVGWHAAHEPNWRIPTPPVWLGVALSFALVLFAVVRGRWWRAASGTAVAALLALLVWHPFPPEFHPGQLEMSVIDVGQGDSILLVFPDGKRMLVDGGGIPAFGHQTRSQLDTGEDVVAPYLWDRGIRNIDIVALSHAHDDHIGGLPALVADFHPRELWTGATPESAGWGKLHDEAVRDHVKIEPMSAPGHFDFGGASLDVLAPLSDYVPNDTPKNNDSLVLRIRYGSRTFLLTGDVEKPIEYRMLDENEIQPVDVLKVAHHGSRTSTTEDFLSAANPMFAIISVGEDNSYGHPNRDVLTRLNDHHAEVLRTDRNGLVTVRTDGKRLTVETRY
jgi:competence protein ComEC